MQRIHHKYKVFYSQISLHYTLRITLYVYIVLYYIIIILLNKYVTRRIFNTFAFYFDSIRYEKKQIVVYKAWEYERNEMQVAMRHVIDDLEFLKDVNSKLKQTMRKRKYVRIKFMK